MIYTPAKRLAAANNGIQQSKAVIERLDELFKKEKESEGKGDVKPISSYIEFKNVSFKYPASKHYILDDINLTVKKGRLIAIVGRSGAGKTSLVDLIPRFYDPVSGAIYIDGVNITDVNLKSLRQQIGLVSQDVILFNDTVRANITFGNPDASEEDIIRLQRQHMPMTLSSNFQRDTRR